MNVQVGSKEFIEKFVDGFWRDMDAESRGKLLAADRETLDRLRELVASMFGGDRRTSAPLTIAIMDECRRRADPQLLAFADMFASFGSRS